MTVGAQYKMAVTAARIVSRQSPTAVRIDATLVARLYRQAQASRWGVSERAFTAALERSAAKALPDGRRIASASSDT